jgi:hypothetical protein
MRITCYFDYKCRDSHRVSTMLFDARDADEDLKLQMMPFSLKELNRDEGAPSVLNVNDTDSISVLALALCMAAMEAEFDRYHRTVFDVIQCSGVTLIESDLLALAAVAGVDVEKFNANRRMWLRRLYETHHEAARRWGVSGTPTLVFDGRAAVLVTLGDGRIDAHRSGRLIRELGRTALDYPEIKKFNRY